jgi:hypothetical protein
MSQQQEITTVYRGRRWVDMSATNEMVAAYRDGRKMTFESVMDGITQSQDGWKTYYEPCPVIKRTAKFITVKSETIPNSPFYAGGDFRLSIEDLHRDGKVYHSRHGEYFYLNPPTVSEPWFPSEVKQNLLP